MYIYIAHPESPGGGGGVLTQIFGVDQIYVGGGFRVLKHGKNRADFENENRGGGRQYHGTPAPSPSLHLD